LLKKLTLNTLTLKTKKAAAHHKAKKKHAHKKKKHHHVKHCKHAARRAAKAKDKYEKKKRKYIRARNDLKYWGKYAHDSEHDLKHIYKLLERGRTKYASKWHRDHLRAALKEVARERYWLWLTLATLKKTQKNLR